MERLVEIKRIKNLTPIVAIKASVIGKSLCSRFGFRVQIADSNTCG